jgi:hypothetical protein
VTDSVAIAAVSKAVNNMSIPPNRPSATKSKLVPSIAVASSAAGRPPIRRAHQAVIASVVSAASADGRRAAVAVRPSNATAAATVQWYPTGLS